MSVSYRQLPSWPSDQGTNAASLYYYVDVSKTIWEKRCPLSPNYWNCCVLSSLSLVLYPPECNTISNNWTSMVLSPGYKHTLSLSPFFLSQALISSLCWFGRFWALGGGCSFAVVRHHRGGVTEPGVIHNSITSPCPCEKNHWACASASSEPIIPFFPRIRLLKKKKK